jgi:cardiolipin synthase
MSLSSLPNSLSALRIILTVPVVISLLNHEYFLTLGLFFIAGISDGLDGFIAKRFNCQSRLGSILDPVADKILLVASFVALFWIGVLPLWLLMLMFVRDLMIVSGAIGWFMGSDNEKNTLLSPSKLSKINTVLQIMLVLCLVLFQVYPVNSEVLQALFMVVATSTVLSGADYIWVWFEKIIKQNQL